MECKTIDNPTYNIKLNIINFINKYGCTEDGNITEMTLETLDRLLSMPLILILLIKNNDIIGTIFSIIIRINNDILSSYTTFLCIKEEYRKQGLALILIDAAKEEGNKRNVNHGYYMTYKNINNNNDIKSWYRPINIKNAINAGFSIYNENKTKQRLMYHISKPTILPKKATNDDYEKILVILKKGQLYLTPTFEEYVQLMTCFDIYIVENGLFMLFPMSIFISSTGKRVKNAHLALMIGDLLPHVLWVASEHKYDLLYGWCVGDITEEKIIKAKGCITTSNVYLSYFNTDTISNQHMMLPIF